MGMWTTTKNNRNKIDRETRHQQHQIKSEEMLAAKGGQRWVDGCTNWVLTCISNCNRESGKMKLCRTYIDASERKVNNKWNSRRICGEKCCCFCCCSCWPNNENSKTTDVDGTGVVLFARWCYVVYMDCVKLFIAHKKFWLFSDEFSSWNRFRTYASRSSAFLAASSVYLYLFLFGLLSILVQWKLPPLFAISIDCLFRLAGRLCCRYIYDASIKKAI